MSAPEKHHGGCSCESHRDPEPEGCGCGGGDCGCGQGRCACGCSCGCNCGCHVTCDCGCHDGSMSFRRRFTSRAERIAQLEKYLEELRAEAQGVEEAIAELREA